MNKWQHLYLLNVDEFQRFCKTGLLALYGRNMGEITADRFSDPELANDLELIDHLFSQCPSVEDLSDWVIISMNRQSMFAEYAEIDDVTAVFALDERSRLIISQKLFDRRIKIRPPLFNPNMLCRIVARKKRYSGTRADELLWKILDLPHGDIKIDCMKAVTYKDISRANTDALTGRGVFGEDTSIWSSLLRYERRMDFPQGLLGFFYDSVLIFFSHIAAVCKPRSQEEMDDLAHELIDDLDCFKKLDAMKSQSKPPEGLNAIFSILEDEPSFKDFEDFTSESVPDFNWLRSSVMFLFMKDLFKGGNFDLHKEYAGRSAGELLNELKAAWTKDFCLAIWLLGASLEFPRVRDAWYDFKGLEIFSDGPLVCNEKND